MRRVGYYSLNPIQSRMESSTNRIWSRDSCCLCRRTSQWSMGKIISGFFPRVNQRNIIAVKPVGFVIYSALYISICTIKGNISLEHGSSRGMVALLVCDLNRTPNCYGKTWRFLCPFFINLHLRENLARDCFTSTVSTVTNSVQNIFTHLRYCDK